MNTLYRVTVARAGETLFPKNMRNVKHNVSEIFSRQARFPSTSSRHFPSGSHSPGNPRKVPKFSQEYLTRPCADPLFPDIGSDERTIRNFGPHDVRKYQKVVPSYLRSVVHTSTLRSSSTEGLNRISPSWNCRISAHSRRENC